MSKKTSKKLISYWIWLNRPILIHGMKWLLSFFGASWIFIQEISLRSWLWHKRRFTDKNEQSLGVQFKRWLKQRQFQFLLYDKVSVNVANCVPMSRGYVWQRGIGSAFFSTSYFLSQGSCWGYHLTFNRYNLELDALGPFDKKCRFFIFMYLVVFIPLPTAFHNHMYTSFEAFYRRFSGVPQNLIFC